MVFWTQKQQRLVGHGQHPSVLRAPDAAVYAEPPVDGYVRDPRVGESLVQDADLGCRGLKIKACDAAELWRQSQTEHDPNFGAWCQNSDELGSVIGLRGVSGFLFPFQGLCLGKGCEVSRVSGFRFRV
jgi:hypothetical protein